MGEVIIWLASFVSASGGAIAYALWQKWKEDTERAQKDKDDSLRERVDIIGGEIKARLVSLENRVGSIEKTLDDFKRETQFALRSHREHNEKILEGVKGVIARADALQKDTGQKVKVLEDQMQTFMGWLKKSGNGK